MPNDTPQEIDKILKTISVTTAHLAPGHCEIVKMDTAEAKQALQKLIASKEAVAEERGYGKGAVDTLEHVKKWADETEETYNQMMSNRLATLKANLVKEEDSSNAPN